MFKRRRRSSHSLRSEMALRLRAAIAAGDVGGAGKVCGKFYWAAGEAAAKRRNGVDNDKS